MRPATRCARRRSSDSRQLQGMPPDQLRSARRGGQQAVCGLTREEQDEEAEDGRRPGRVRPSNPSISAMPILRARNASTRVATPRASCTHGLPRPMTFGSAISRPPITPVARPIQVRMRTFAAGVIGRTCCRAYPGQAPVRTSQSSAPLRAISSTEATMPAAVVQRRLAQAPRVRRCAVSTTSGIRAKGMPN